MSAESVARWVIAVLVFLAIGVLDSRYGHRVGLTALVAFLLLVFVLDGLARRGAAADANDDPEAPEPMS